MNLIMKCIVILLVVAFVLWLTDDILVVVGANEIGVVYDASKGLLPDTMATGWHFKLPIVQSVTKVKTARDTINMYGTYEECQADPDCDDIAIAVPSKEGLEITLDVSLFYRVKPEKAVDVIKSLTPNYIEGTINPTIRSSTRDVAGGMAVTELYGTGREKLEIGIVDKIKPRLEADGFIVEEILIRDVKIPDQIRTAIENKQKTEQEFLQKEFEVKKEELEAQRKIIEAEGIANAKLKIAEAEAKAIDLQGKALRENPNVVQLRWIEKWNGVMPISTGGSLPLINIPMME